MKSDDERTSRIAPSFGGDTPRRLHIIARLRNYFLTGLIIAGPVFLEFRTQMEENRGKLKEGEQNIRTIQTTRAAVAAASGQPTPRAARSQPASPGKIKIYGLDEGPREIEVKR